MVSASPGFSASQFGRRALPWIIGLLLLYWVPVLHAGLFDDDSTPPKQSEHASKNQPSETRIPPAAEPPKSQPSDVTPPVSQGQPPELSRALPDAASRVKSGRLFAEVYAGALKDRSPAARRKLAQSLLEEAAKADKGSADRFVLLNAARQAAEEGQDVRLSFRAAKKLAAEYDVDELATKTEAATKIFSAASLAPLVSTNNIEALLDLADQLLAEDDLTDLIRVESILQRTISSIGDAGLKMEVRSQIQEITAIRETRHRIEPELVKLNKSPNDPAANFVVGSYLCFLRGHWEQGLPYLAKSSDARLKSIAVSELSHASQVDGIVKLADRWLAEAPSLPGPDRPKVMQHAADLYRSAEASSVGLEATLIEQKLASIPSSGRPHHVDLLDLFDPQTSMRQGKWQMEEGGLVSDPGDWARAQFAYTPPDEYDFVVSFSVLQGDDEVGQVCYCAGHQFYYAVGEDHNKFAAFGLVNGVEGRHTALAKKKDRWLLVGKHYVSIVKVRRSGVEAYLNGQLITGLKTNYSNLSLLGTRRLSRSDIVGISAYFMTVQIDSAEIVEISGRGVLVETQHTK